jgi:hypothetical protein
MVPVVAAATDRGAVPTAVPVTGCYIDEDILEQLMEAVNEAGRALETVNRRIDSLEALVTARNNARN